MGSSTQNDVTHIQMVVDMSGSMSRLSDAVIRVVDDLVAKFDELSTTLSQETRVTVYVFDDVAECVFYDMDVRRRPSLKGHYRPRGMTAMIDAVLMSLEDQRMTPKKYGKHAFLTYVITDGYQNAGRQRDGAVLAEALSNLNDDETVACLVPGAEHAFVAKKLGFPAGNVAVWDATSTHGVERAAETIYQATTTYMTSRSTTGLRSTTNLFSMDASTLNAQTVKQNLTPLSPDDYALVHVTPPPKDYENGKYWWIKDFAEFSGHKYIAGNTGYYQFVYVKGKKASEVVSPTKKVIVVERSTGLAYGGPAARQILNLPDNKSERIKFDRNPDYDIYILSSANNRHLIPGTNLLIWKK